MRTEVTNAQSCLKHTLAKVTVPRTVSCQCGPLGGTAHQPVDMVRVLVQGVLYKNQSTVVNSVISLVSLGRATLRPALWTAKCQHGPPGTHVQRHAVLGNDIVDVQ